MVLTSKPPQFIPLSACRSVNALAGVPLGLLHPSGNRLCGRLELTRQLFGRAARSHQIDHLSPELRRISGSVTRHQTPPKSTSRVSTKPGQLQVWSVVIVSVGEGVDEGLEFVDAAGQVVCGVEFVSPGGLGAFDAAVEVGTFWRQDYELEAVFLAMILEDGHELGSAVDLDAFDLERSGGDELVEQGFCGAGGSVGGDVGKGPFGDRVVGGEVLEGPVGTQVD